MSSVAESNTKININMHIIYTDIYRKFSRREILGCRLFFAGRRKKYPQVTCFFFTLSKGILEALR